MTDQTQAALLRSMIEIVEQFRVFNKDVTANQILTFLYVAEANAKAAAITQTDTLKRLDLVTGGSSRIVAALSSYGDRGGKAWEVISIDENPHDRRYKLLSLTSKGKTLVSNLIRTFEAGCRQVLKAEA